MLSPKKINPYLFPDTRFKLPNDEEIIVRLATVNDLEEIMEIQRACYGKAPWGRIAVINELKNKVNSLFIICYHYTEAVAFISLSYRRKAIHITNIATIPSFQRLGIATFLIREAGKVGRTLDCKLMTLEVRVSNETAKSLYRTLGFEDGSIKKNYYHDNREDALNMAYNLEKVDDYEDIQSIK